MVCTCRNGFFRADTDPADSACTSESCSGQGGEAREAVEVVRICVWGGGICCAHARGELAMKTHHPCPSRFPAGVPSAPRNVISNVNETSLGLEWSEPQDTGGRDDLLYNVICKKCSVERRLCTRCDDNVEFVPRQLGLTERRIYISNLMAHTQYTFEIQAVNGISNKSPYAPHFASVNITTNQAGQWSHQGAGAVSPPQSRVEQRFLSASLGACSPLWYRLTGSLGLHLIPWVNCPLCLRHVPRGDEIRMHASAED